MAKRPEPLVPPQRLHWIVLRCASCGLPVCRPVLHQRFPEGLRGLNGEDSLPEGACLSPEETPQSAGPHREPGWLLNLEDILGVSTGEGFGCCGTDGESEDLTCTAGHTLGSTCSECCLPGYAWFAADRVIPEFRPLEQAKGWIDKFGPWDLITGLTPPEDSREFDAWAWGGRSLGLAWDEPFPRRSRRADPRSSHRWAVEAKGECLDLLHWFRAKPATERVRSLGVVPRLPEGVCVPLTMEWAVPGFEGFTADVDARTLDDQWIRFTDPHWPLQPHAWHGAIPHFAYHEESSQAWVRLVGLLHTLEADPRGETDLFGQSPPCGELVYFKARFGGWEREGRFIGLVWRKGWLEFPSLALKRLPFWSWVDRVEATLPGARVQGCLRLQGLHVEKAQWDEEGPNQRRHRQDLRSNLETLRVTSARNRFIGSLVHSFLKDGTTRGHAGERERVARLDWKGIQQDLTQSLRAWLDGQGSLDAITVRIREVFPRTIEGDQMRVETLLKGMVWHGLLDPDRAASKT